MVPCAHATRTKQGRPHRADPAPATAEAPPSKRAAVAAAAIAGAALMSGGVGAVTALGVSEDSVSTTTVVDAGETVSEARPAAANATGLSVGEIYAAVSEGVVEITVTSSTGSLQTPFGQEAEPSTAQGSGFVFDKQGHIVTNQHVVDGADAIKVTLADGSSYDARLVCSDASTDLAVLEIDASEDVLDPLELGDSDALAVGEAVVAIGSPFGLDTTVTSGIVSAVDRQITAPRRVRHRRCHPDGRRHQPGNSGGPLLNASAPPPKDARGRPRGRIQTREHDRRSIRRRRRSRRSAGTCGESMGTSSSHPQLVRSTEHSHREPPRGERSTVRRSTQHFTVRLGHLEGPDRRCAARELSPPAVG